MKWDGFSFSLFVPFFTDLRNKHKTSKECSLRARQPSKYFTNTNTFKFSQPPCDKDTGIVLCFTDEKPGHREAKQLARGHTASKWQSRDSNPDTGSNAHARKRRIYLMGCGLHTVPKSWYSRFFGIPNSHVLERSHRHRFSEYWTVASRGTPRQGSWEPLVATFLCHLINTQPRFMCASV